MKREVRVIKTKVPGASRPRADEGSWSYYDEPLLDLEEFREFYFVSTSDARPTKMFNGPSTS